MQQNSFGCLGLIAFCFIFQLLIQTIFNPTEKLSNKSRVNYDSFGKVKIGMTVTQAEKAGQIKFLQLNGNPGQKKGCFYIKPQSNLQFYRVKFMVVNGIISTLEINNENIETIAGIRIGYEEYKLAFSYGIKDIQIATNPLSKKRYFIYTPPKAKNYRMIFESDKKYITRYRIGKTPEVNYPNGCANYRET